MRHVLFAFMFSLAMAIGSWWIAPSAFAATTTVCASGCDYPTIGDAISFGSFSTGDAITVGADYASSTEVFPFNIPPGVNLDCENSGAIIGIDATTTFVTMNSQGDNAIRNCTFSSVQLQSTNVDDVQILNNTFQSNSSLTADFSSNITVDNNIVHQHIGFHNVTTTVISNNLIIAEEGYGVGSVLLFSAATDTTVTNNLIRTEEVNIGLSVLVGDFGNLMYGLILDNNIIDAPNLEFSNGGDMVRFASAQNVVATNNLITVQGQTPPGSYINGFRIEAGFSPSSVTMSHNTVKIKDSITYADGYTINNWDFPMSVTSTYNIAYRLSASSTASTGGFASFAAGPGPLTVFSEYNGFYNLAGNDTTDFPTGSGSLTGIDPAFRTADADPDNDFELAPFSDFLDINGTDDIGAKPGVRGNSFHVNASAVVNYTTNDATSTLPLMASLRSSDTVEFAAGTYQPVSLQFGPRRSNNLTITGAGAGTIFDVSTTGSAFALESINNSLFSNFTVQHASSSIVESYNITRAQYTDGVTTYDQGVALGAPNGVIVVTDPPSGGSCNTTIVDHDGFDVTSLINTYPGNWNLALVDYLGIKLTLMGPAANIPTALSVTGCAPGAVTVEHFITDIFTESSGVFSYGAGAALSAGVSVKTGDTDPPSITRGIIGGDAAGFYVSDSDNNLFVNVTSTNNSNGIAFMGSAQNNVIRDSALASNVLYDILGNTTIGSNTLRDVDFTRASSTITNVGPVNVEYTARAFVQDNGSNPLEGIQVTFNAANAATTTTMTTDASGYTPYTAPLPAFTLTSSSLDVTNGGFNPYTVIANTTSSYQTASSPLTLNSRGKLVSLAMFSNAVSSGGGGAGGLPSTSAPWPIGTMSSNSSGTPEAWASIGLYAHDLLKLKDDGNPKTQQDTTVYYLGADGKRHVFPNTATYFSWYCDFSRVKTVSVQVMAQIPLGANVTFRPGLRLVKFTTDPKVYLVQPDATLRPIADELTAVALLGKTWNKQVFDINDAFRANYEIGEQIRLNEVGDTLRFQSDVSHPSSQMSIASYTDPHQYVCLSVSQPTTVAPVASSIAVPKAYAFTLGLQVDSTQAIDIRYLQTLLIALGEKELTVTGNFGTQTTAAVKRFQAKHGLTQTGALGPATRAALNAELSKIRP